MVHDKLGGGGGAAFTEFWKTIISPGINSFFKCSNAFWSQDQEAALKILHTKANILHFEAFSGEVELLPNS